MSIAQQHRKLKRFAQASGFTGFVIAKTVNEGILGFHYDSFDPKLVRKMFKTIKKHTPSGMFLFSIDKTKSVRVDTDKKIVLLADGPLAVKALFNSF